ncbi:MAG: type I DNA topoisomerase [Bacteroidetes bacterium]|nr:type I DNA topoisomerase [Bacteroidota bacterium]
MAKKKESVVDSKDLLIVESPAKAKTIEKFLDNKFLVRSSYGHIRDLPKSDKAIDVDNNFKPTYEITEEKEDVVKELKKLMKDAGEVWLATDEDREGEAIAWHLCEALGLNAEKTKRIVFHEITKGAIKNAVASPRTVNKALVDAQQARRILDRLVGFKLSPILWRKISRGSQNLSAGRVQSVAVRIIVDREREINAFKTASSYKVAALFQGVDAFKNKVTIKAELPQNKPTQKDAEAFLKGCIGSTFTVKDVQKKPGKKSPPAPFTTSTIQQEAARKFGFSVARTMNIAQRLYESGKITYMRTDSTNLSETAVQSISAEITQNYGNQYLQNRTYSTKTANAQEAHEAIRPSYIEEKEIEGEADEQKLYSLIWKRTIASQMSDAQLEKTAVRIGISNLPQEELIANGEVLLFDGFLKVYMESNEDDQAEDTTVGLLPDVKAGEVLRLSELTATERFSRPPARYNEASLVKKLEELGIGRPSTYAPTISTIQKRGYVEKASRDGNKRNYTTLTLQKDQIIVKTAEENTGVERNKLFPTDIGMLVNDFLVAHFNSIVDFNFTAEIEKEFDDISNGLITWEKMIGNFYKPFSKNVEETLETAERVTGERELGIDPASGKKVIARMARFGPIVQIGSPEDDTKPRMAGLRPGMSLETITIEDALKLFDLPRKLGQFEEKEVTVNTGRFGPYILYDGKFISLKKGMDPYEVSMEQAIELIDEKRNSVIREWKEQGVSILVGRFGPYIKSGRLNAKVPKDTEPEKLTLEECLELLEAAKNTPRKGGGFRFKRKG